MVKKHTAAAVLLVILLLSLCACGKTGNAFIDSGVKKQTITVGSSKLKVGHISISKAAAEEAGMQDFVDFVFEKVDGQGYAWFTVYFEDDHTGIVFVSGSPYIAQYGLCTISDWSLIEPYGNLTFDDSSRTYAYQEFSDEED